MRTELFTLTSSLGLSLLGSFLAGPLESRTKELIQRYNIQIRMNLWGGGGYVHIKVMGLTFQGLKFVTIENIIVRFILGIKPKKCADRNNFLERVEPH